MPFVQTRQIVSNDASGRRASAARARPSRLPLLRSAAARRRCPLHPAGNASVRPPPTRHRTSRCGSESDVTSARGGARDGEKRGGSSDEQPAAGVDAVQEAIERDDPEVVTPANIIQAVHDVNEEDDLSPLRSALEKARQRAERYANIREANEQEALDIAGMAISLKDRLAEVCWKTCVCTTEQASCVLYQIQDVPMLALVRSLHKTDLVLVADIEQILISQ